MDKLKMAHEYFMKHVNTDQYRHLDDEDLISWSFDYVDAMQTKADQRKKAEAAQKRKEVREILNDPNTFIEREGQHFDDVEEAKREGEYFFKLFCRQNGIDDVEEWQPDWSQAPAWANWWSVDENGTANFSGKKPHIEGHQWVYYSAAGEKPSHIEAPSFGFTGNWQDSLRKRPEALQPEVDWQLAPNDAIGWMLFDGASTWLGESGYLIEEAPSFGFKGTHIVERPHVF